MPLLSTTDLVRDLRARRIMVDGGNGNVYDVADEVCEQAVDLIEDLERKIALVVAHDSNLIDHFERHAEPLGKDGAYSAGSSEIKILKCHPSSTSMARCTPTPSFKLATS